MQVLQVVSKKNLFQGISQSRTQAKQSGLEAEISAPDKIIADSQLLTQQSYKLPQAL